MIRNKRHLVVLIALVASMFAGSVTASARVPVVDLHPPTAPVEHRRAPDVSANAWIVFDASRGIVLGSSNADTRLAMASTTKMMTGLLAYELADPDAVVTVSQEAADVGEAEIGLIAGEQIPLRDLITVMLVRSANDAAVAVAQTVSGDVASFVQQMNTRAGELGLTRSQFVNPHGLDAEGHFSTARDLLRLGLAAMANPAFREAAVTRTFALEPDPEGTQRTAEATNELLGAYPGAIGVKTGFTFQAGLVLVGAAEKDGTTIYVVVMGSEGEGAHFADATALLDFGFAGHRLVDAVSGDSVFDGTLVHRTGSLVSQMYVAALFGDGTAPSLGSVAAPSPAEEGDDVLPSLLDAFGWLIRGDDA